MRHRNKKPKASNAEAMFQRMNYRRMIRQIVALKKEIGFKETMKKGSVRHELAKYTIVSENKKQESFV